MVFFDVENSSRREHVASMLAHLGLPDRGNHTRVVAIGNWRVVSAETARLLAHAGADLIHSAPVLGVKDWSDLRIAVDAGRWLGGAHPADVLEIVSDDQAFDAVGDVAATIGVLFRRISHRSLRRGGIIASSAARPSERAARRRRQRRRPISRGASPRGA
jgi:hypothetical protein